MRSIQQFFAWQVTISRRIDRRLFGAFAVDGNDSFNKFLPTFVRDNSTLADIGGGKTPFFSAVDVARHGLRVTGVDIDAAELGRAEAGSYVETMVGPIEEVRGRSDKDYVIAQSVLEHVNNGRAAIEGMGSFLRPGGKVVTFCPCKRAWFARLNTVIPEDWKRAVLFYIFPGKRERQGFPAHYDGCSPSDMQANLQRAGIRVVEERLFFTSSYFMFFVPLYLTWRLATFPLMKLWPRRYCETFIMIGEKD